MLRIFRPQVDAATSANFTLRRQLDRAADEFVGVCRGILAGGAVSSQEAHFLLDWCELNARARTAGDSRVWFAPTGKVADPKPLLTLSVGFDRLQRDLRAISPDQAGTTTERSDEN